MHIKNVYNERDEALIEKIHNRINDITKRHTEALRKELEPYQNALCEIEKRSIGKEVVMNDYNGFIVDDIKLGDIINE